MVEFGKKLLSLRHEPWRDYYLDYEALKQILNGHDPSNEEEDPPEESNTFIFVHILNIEIEKILLFYLEKKGNIAKELSTCRSDHLRLSADDGASTGAVAKLEASYNAVAMDLLLLIRYVDVNITAVRKILKKHDKNMGEEKLFSVYFGSNRQPSMILHPLVSDESLSVLVQILDSAFMELRAWQQPPKPVHQRRQSVPLWMDYNVAEATSASPHFTIHSAQVSTRKSISTELPSNPFKTIAPTSIMMHIHAAHRGLRQTSEFAEYLASTMMVEPDSATDEGDDLLDSTYQERPRSEFSNWLNLLSTFLYMASYYIVAPSSATYAEKLGSPPVLSGIIIGMTPIAALVSTVLYSWWTSYSYKAALIFASACSVLGNLLYAAGLPYNSLTMVFVGRLLNGFGSARSINRRYIADTFSRKERTAASAAFVTAGALGMAAGPAIASLVHFTIPDNSTNLYWQVENSVGWVMGLVWAIYLLCLVVGFTDPPKPESHNENGSNSERKGLLSNGDPVSSEPPLWRNIPVMTTFWIYFVLKFALEASLSSTAMLTKFYFGWEGDKSGMYMAALGLLMLPANYGVARLSRSYSDRELILVLQVLLLVGCLVLIKYTSHYSLVHYIVGSIAIFIGANALEGPNMSLLSKVRRQKGR